MGGRAQTVRFFYKFNNDPHRLVRFSHQLTGLGTLPEQEKYKSGEKGKAPEYIPNQTRKGRDKAHERSFKTVKFKAAV